MTITITITITTVLPSLLMVEGAAHKVVGVMTTTTTLTDPHTKVQEAKDTGRSSLRSWGTMSGHRSRAGRRRRTKDRRRCSSSSLSSPIQSHWVDGRIFCIVLFYCILCFCLIDKLTTTTVTLLFLLFPSLPLHLLIYYHGAAEWGETTHQTKQKRQ